MRTQSFLATCLALASLAFVPASYAKDKKRPEKAKLAKECTDKGGTWNKKKKKCTPAPEKASAPKDESTDLNHDSSAPTDPE